MERMNWQQESGTLLVGQSPLNQGQIQILVTAIQFVADDRMPQVREMDADLVLATGERMQP